MKNQNYHTSLDFGLGNGFEADLHAAFSTSKFFDPDAIQETSLLDGIGEVVDFEDFFAQNLTTEEEEI